MSTRSHRDRAADKQGCEAVVNSCSVLVPVPEELYTPEVAAWYESASPIQEIGYRLFGAFKAAAVEEGHDDLPWMVIEHGFIVVTTGIEKCKAAYSKHCIEQGLIYSEDLLVKALRSPKTLRFFTFIANMPNSQNRCYESYFNLGTGASGREFYEEFEFDPETSSFTPNPLFKLHAQMEASAYIPEDEGLGDVPNEDKVCPAIHLIPRIWHDAVNACLDVGVLRK